MPTAPPKLYITATPKVWIKAYTMMNLGVGMDGGGGERGRGRERGKKGARRDKRECEWWWREEESVEGGGKCWGCR